MDSEPDILVDFRGDSHAVLGLALRISSSGIIELKEGSRVPASGVKRD